MKLTLNEITIILQLLERVTINGKEANTFLQVVSKLRQIAKELSEPTKIGTENPKVPAGTPLGKEKPKK